MNYCRYGCGNEGTFKQKNGQWCCSDHWLKCPEKKKNFKWWNTGLTKETSPKLAKIGKNISKAKQGCVSSTKGLRGEECGWWKGGSYSHYHNHAYRKFSNKKCVICGMTEEQHKEKYNKRLGMHCRTGNYRLLEEWNWVDVCEKHHCMVDAFDGRDINQYKKAS